MVSLTGIELLDQKLEGTLPKGYTILVQGAPGTGIEFFAKQFAAKGGSDENIVYITTSESTENIEQTLEAYGWGPEMRIVNISSEYYENILSKELHISRYRHEGIRISDVIDFKAQPGVKKDINFLTLLSYEVVKTKPPFRIVIDSLDFFFQHYDEEKVLSTVNTLKAHAQHYDSVLLVTMLKGAYPRRLQSVVEGVMDLIIELDVEKMDSDINHSLLIKKVRNHPEKVGYYSFSIVDEGFQIS